MARRKQTPPKSVDDQNRFLEFPTTIDLQRQLTARTREPLERLKNVASAAELRAFCEEVLDTPFSRETLAVAVRYISIAWGLMRRIYRETRKIAPPPKPDIMLPEYDKAGVPIPPEKPALVKNNRRCWAAYVNPNWAEIPVDERCLENAVAEIIKWCSDTEAAEKPRADHRRGKKAEKRSWTQFDLDEAIEKDISKYAETLADARAGKKVALQQVRKLFRRNAVADRLGVKEGSRRMVSKSRPWQTLVDEFEMPRKSGAESARDWSGRGLQSSKRKPLSMLAIVR